MSVLRRAALGLILALMLAPQALADGDPASDILAPADTRVYMTLAAPDSSLEKELAATAQKVTDAGLPIKVAVIGNKTDLGAVPQLWAKPQTYARFLGSELRFIYKDTLLVVMPQGFGINGPYTQPKALAALQGIDPRKDPSRAGAHGFGRQGACARSQRPAASRSALPAAEAGRGLRCR